MLLLLISIIQLDPQRWTRKCFLLNRTIINLEKLPFSVWHKIQCNITGWLELPMITSQPTFKRGLHVWTPHSASFMSNMTTYHCFIVNITVISSLSYLLDFPEILC
jgi:hypothetical protein